MNLWVPNKTFPLNSYVYKHKCNVTGRIQTIALPGPPRRLGPEPPHSSVCRPWTLHLSRSNVRRYTYPNGVWTTYASQTPTPTAVVFVLLSFGRNLSGGGGEIIKKTIVKPAYYESGRRGNGATLVSSRQICKTASPCTHLSRTYTRACVRTSGADHS